MGENVTLSAYERLLKNLVQFREQYEIFDSNVVKAIETFNSNALKNGASYIQQKAGKGFGEYVLYLRQKVYGTARTMGEKLYAVYKKRCKLFDESPKSYNLTFKSYSELNHPGNSSGKIELRNPKEAYDTCSFVRAHLISSYPILGQSYSRLSSAVNDAQRSVMVKDVPEINVWMKTIGDGIRAVEMPYRSTIRTLDELMAKLNEQLR